MNKLLIVLLMSLSLTAQAKGGGGGGGHASSGGHSSSSSHASESAHVSESAHETTAKPSVQKTKPSTASYCWYCFFGHIFSHKCDSTKDKNCKDTK
jgi:hypothetical protein